MALLLSGAGPITELVSVEGVLELEPPQLPSASVPVSSTAITKVRFMIEGFKRPVKKLCQHPNFA